MGSTLERLQNIDRRIIYTIVFVVLIVPMFRPMGLPLKITREAQASFDTVDALPPGTLVLFTTAIAPGTEAELGPQSLAVLKHCLTKGLRVAFAPTAAESPRYCDKYAEMFAAAGKVAGKDYLELPYLAGGETLFAAIGSDIKSAYNMIAPGQSELWDSMDGMQDFGLVVDVGGGESQLWALAHIESKHHTPTICLITAVILAVRQPYFTSGQFKGIVSGLNGAAEYEVLTKTPGTAVAGMDAQSLGHLWIIVAILLGNAAMFLSRGQKASGTGGAR